MAVQPLLNSKIIIKKDTAILVIDNDSKQKEVNHKQIKMFFYYTTQVNNGRTKNIRLFMKNHILIQQEILTLMN